MTRWRSIWLVARREILERGRSRGFILSVLFTTLIVVGSFVVPALLFGDAAATKVGVVEPAPAGPRPADRAATAARFDQKVAITTYPDAAAAEPRSTDGTVDVVVAMPADLSGPGEVRFDKEPDQAHRPAHLRPRRSRCASRPCSAQSDVDQARARRRRSSRRPSSALEPQTEADQARFLVANIGAVLSSSASSASGSRS